MMYLTKEATNKDQSLKMQLLYLADDKPTLETELIWKKSSFFGDEKGEFTINKANFPENALIYANQGSILTLKTGDFAIYLDYIILGQLICAKNLSEECKPDEVKLHVPLYNVDRGELQGLQNSLPYIMVRGDENETFLSYGYDKDKSNILFSPFKQMLLNIFQGTSFKKHHPMLLDERSVQEYSTLFFYLPSMTDSKENINQFVKNVSLDSIDCRYEDFKKYSRDQTDVRPQDLDAPDLNKRLAAR